MLAVMSKLCCKTEREGLATKNPYQGPASNTNILGSIRTLQTQNLDMASENDSHWSPSHMLIIGETSVDPSPAGKTQAPGPLGSTTPLR